MFDEDAKIRQEIRRLSKLAKKHPLLFARLGDYHLRLGEIDRAQSVLKGGLKEFPDYVVGYRILAEACLYKGFYREAEEHCLKGLERDPNHLGLLHLLMLTKKKMENEWEVSRLQSTLANLDPLHTLMTSGWVEQQENAPEIAEVEGATDIPTPGEIWKLKAASREKAEASDALVATSIKPGADGLPAYLNEIVISSQPGAVSQSAGPDPAGESTPSSGRIATRTLGELYAQQDKFDEAIEIYQRLLDGDPENESYRSRLQELINLHETLPARSEDSHDGKN